MWEDAAEDVGEPQDDRLGRLARQQDDIERRGSLEVHAVVVRLARAWA